MTTTLLTKPKPTQKREHPMNRALAMYLAAMLFAAAFLLINCPIKATPTNAEPTNTATVSAVQNATQTQQPTSTPQNTTPTPNPLPPPSPLIVAGTIVGAVAVFGAFSSLYFRSRSLNRKKRV
jgi:cytoskeletal protein RodZ